MKTMRLVAGLIGVATYVLAAPSSRLSARTTPPPANPACALVTAAELERALGAAVTGLSNGPSGLPDGVEVCTGTIPGATIGIRLIPQLSQETADARKKLIDLMMQMGAHVDVNTNGPISCQAITPPPAMTSIGFATWCSASKPPKLAVIEIETKTHAVMVQIDTLRALALKMLGRL